RVARSFPGQGSVWRARTLATVSAVPGRLSAIRAVIVATRPASRAPSWHETMRPLGAQRPLLVDRDLSCAPAGSRPVTVTPVAREGPRAETRRRYVVATPARAGAEGATEIPRSAAGLTLSARRAWSSAGWESVAGLLTRPLAT